MSRRRAPPPPPKAKRDLLVKKAEFENLQRLTTSACKIQAAFTHTQKTPERNGLQKLRHHTVRLQCHFRMRRCYLLRRSMLAAVVRVQSAFRQHHYRNLPCSLKYSRVLIAAKKQFEKLRARKKERIDFAKMHKLMLEMSDDATFAYLFKPAVMYIGFRYAVNPFKFFADGLTPIIGELTERLAKSDTPDHIVKLTCGKSSCVALTFSGKLFTFGIDRLGQLGYHVKTPSAKAHMVEALFTRCITPPNVRVVVVKISTGKNHTCSLSNDGR